MPDVTMSVTLIDGSVLRGVGKIATDTWETQDGKLTLSLIPKDNRWEVVVGSATGVFGSLKKVTLNGQTFDVLTDANFSLVPSEYGIEGRSTSGNTIYVYTKRPRVLSQVTLQTGVAGAEQIRAMADAV